MIFLIIGLGSIARKHIEAIKYIHPEADIFALRSSMGVSGVEGVKDIYNLSELNIVPDYILITNPTHLHEEAIASCLAFHKPMLIEKPLFSSTHDKNGLLAEIKNKGIATYVACNMRFHPALVYLKEALEIQKMRINEVNVYCGSFLPDWRPGKDFRNCYSANAEMGGGVHLDLIHELDYCIWLFGTPMDKRVLLRNMSSLNISACDFANYLLSYKDFCVNITLNYYRSVPKRVIEIVADGIVIECDLITCRVTKNGEEVFHDDKFKMQHTYNEQLRFFLTHLQEGQPIMNDADEAFSILKLALNE